MRLSAPAWGRLLGCVLLAPALFHLCSAAWIEAKAVLAQQLIAGAWARGGDARPWPWADTWPVYRLYIPKAGKDLYVLEDSSGQGLAFGPMRLRNGRGDPDGVVIAGHRDTHFRFTENLVPGEELWLEEFPGRMVRYRVQDARVVDSRRESLTAVAGGLLLVSCYPFDDLTIGGPLRYVVTALPQFIPNPSPAFHDSAAQGPNLSL